MQAHIKRVRREGFTVTRLCSAVAAHRVRDGLDLTDASECAVNKRLPAATLLSSPGASTVTSCVNNADLASLLRQLLSSQPRLASLSSNTLLPRNGLHGPGLGWHVDYPYHDIDRALWPPAGDIHGIQVMLALDDLTTTNGAPEYIPGSHMRACWSGPVELGSCFRPCLLAGEALVAHAAVWHRQTTNFSAAPRTVILATFVPAHVPPKDDDLINVSL